MNTFEDASKAQALLTQHWETNPRKTQSWNRVDVQRDESQPDDCIVEVSITDNETYTRTARKINETAQTLGVFSLVDRITVVRVESVILHTQHVR